MKNLKVSLLFAVLTTGLVLVGCQPQPVTTPAATEDVTGSIRIEEPADMAEVTGSVSITEPREMEVNGAVSITPATDVVATDAAMDTANKAMEEAAVTVN